jgi:hypothetical protein
MLSRSSLFLPRVAFIAMLGTVLGCPVISSADLASLIGGSGYSAKESGEKGIKHIQVVGDPSPGSGSATVLYDPNVLSIYSIFNEANFQIDTANTFVGVTSPPYTLATAQSFFNSDGDFGESGRIQVTWTAAPEAAAGTCYIGCAPTDPYTFNPIASANTSDGGSNTFGLEFIYLPTDQNTLATDTIEATAGGLPTIDLEDLKPGSPSAPDYLTDPSDPTGTAIPFTDIAPATVSGSLNGSPVPEPSVLKLFGVGAMAFLAWRYRGALMGLLH